MIRNLTVNNYINLLDDYSIKFTNVLRYTQTKCYPVGYVCIDDFGDILIHPQIIALQNNNSIKLKDIAKYNIDGRLFTNGILFMHQFSIKNIISIYNTIFVGVGYFIDRDDLYDEHKDLCILGGYSNFKMYIKVLKGFKNCQEYHTSIVT